MTVWSPLSPTRFDAPATYVEYVSWLQTPLSDDSYSFLQHRAPKSILCNRITTYTTVRLCYDTLTRRKLLQALETSNQLVNDRQMSARLTVTHI